MTVFHSRLLFPSDKNNHFLEGLMTSKICKYRPTNTVRHEPLRWYMSLQQETRRTYTRGTDLPGPSGRHRVEEVPNELSPACTSVRPIGSFTLTKRNVQNHRSHKGLYFLLKYILTYCSTIHKNLLFCYVVSI